MFDTYVTVIGNVLTAPEWRRTTQSNTLVANFKVASTARRLDRESGRWVDGNSLRVRVNCWRKLAEGVSSSVMVGDPVVVVGRLYTRDWIDDAGTHRTLYELEAVAVGHDLSRGRGRFLRNRPTLATSTVEDAAADSRVHGEPTEPVPDDQVPVVPQAGPIDDGFEPPELRFTPPIGPASTGGPTGYAPGYGPAPTFGYPLGAGPDRVGAVASPGAPVPPGAVLTDDELAEFLDPADPANEPDAGYRAEPTDPDGVADGLRGPEEPGDPELTGQGLTDGPVTGDGEQSARPTGRARRGRGRVPVPV
ncbi:single-stranded DNA-binding protein [Micromonospora sp. CPCC 206060]|uniref:single-stranded DNA-binding protein n=1 Tax=Micromonospora sp. CPCC 206060 TaxID=3122406 RepID=UPI002FF14401